MRNPSKKQNRLNLGPRDISLILGIMVLGAILNVYPFPFIAAGTIVIGILLSRLNEPPREAAAPYLGQRPNISNAYDIFEVTYQYNSPEQKNAHKEEMARAGFYVPEDDLLPSFMQKSLLLTYRRKPSHTRKGESLCNKPMN